MNECTQRVHNKREKCTLNVCGESHAWNLIIEYVKCTYVLCVWIFEFIVHGQFYGEYWHSKCATLCTHSMQAIGTFDTLFSFITYSWCTVAKCIILNQWWPYEWKKNNTSANVYMSVYQFTSHLLYTTLWQEPSHWSAIVQQLLGFPCKGTVSYQVLVQSLSLIHIWRCRRSTLCRSRWSPYH